MTQLLSSTYVMKFSAIIPSIERNFTSHTVELFAKRHPSHTAKCAKTFLTVYISIHLHI